MTLSPHVTPSAPPMIDTPPPTSGRSNDLRFVLFPARMFLALGWARAGVEKLIDAQWWTGEALDEFIADQSAHALPFAQPIAALIQGPFTLVAAFAVLIAELVIAACLVTGRALAAALWSATALNVSFVMMGVVTPSAFYLVLQMTLLFGITLVPKPREAISHTETFSAAGVFAALALMLAPFAQTLHPHEVIEDPALMLSTVSLLAAATLTVVGVEQRRSPR